LADIFLSYAREDLTQARVLANALEKRGWSVFWDRTHLLAGQDVDEAIELEIEQAGCMIVAWSKASKKSDWVRGEADIAKKLKRLVPIRFEVVDPPIAFRILHTDDLINWNGDADNEDFKKLLRSVTRLVGTATNTVQNPTDQTKSSSPATPSKSATTRTKTSVESSPAYIEPEMVEIHAGQFQMGGDFHDSVKHVHTVTFEKSFFMAKNVVTFEEYDLFAKANKRKFPDDNTWGRAQRPVINVSWEDAEEYASWLSQLTGKSYRLPSEAEWEYAARANTTTEYYWDGLGEAKDYAWYVDNSDLKTHPVCEKRPNAFGLYDMSGNVWEWVEDCWHDNYQNAPIDGSAWDLEGCNYRVLHGGSWYHLRDKLRSAHRYRFELGHRGSDIGFRLAQD
jgi:formylglycine-generating enzyme required for sulfatase activity